MQGEILKLRQYNTRGGVRMPFVFSAGDYNLGVIPMMSDDPSASHMAHAKSFLSKFNRSKVIFISKNNNLKIIDDKMAILPAFLV